MRSLCLLVLVVSSWWQDCVQGRSINIQDSDEHDLLGHLYILDSSTGHSQRLKRRHVESPQEDIQRVRLDLSSVDKVIEIDLQAGSVWDSSSDALLRHGEDVETFKPPVGPNCFYAGRIRFSEGYASLSFCNGVRGIIHTNNESYTIEDIIRHENGDWDNDTDAEFPPLYVKMTFFDGIRTADDELHPVEALECDDEDVYDDGTDDTTMTELPTLRHTTRVVDKDGASTNPKIVRGKATIEVGIYINANYTIILKGLQINSTSQIVDWVINRWNIIRQVYRNTTRIGADVDIKIKHLEIWTKDPAFYYKSPLERQSIRTHLDAFCRRSPEDGVDHKMLYTWEAKKGVVGLSYVGGVCHPKLKCSIVMPQRSGVQRELHEFGHNLGLLHDPQTSNCTWPYGFMGWQNTTEFKDCYRPVFLASLAKPSRDCLFSSRNLTSQMSVYSENKLVPANISISNILDKW